MSSPGVGKVPNIVRIQKLWYITLRSPFFKSGILTKIKATVNSVTSKHLVGCFYTHISKKQIDVNNIMHF